MVKLIVTGILVLGVAAWGSRAEVPARPQLDPNEWWGPAELRSYTNTSVRPFKITFCTEMIEDLKCRLKLHFKHNSRTNYRTLEDAKFNYGFNKKQLDPWLKYWIQDYDFEKRERYFNQYPSYKTNIQGLDIHFLWIKPRVPAGVPTVPLLLLHGWPGSFREFYKAIPLLTKQMKGYNFAFELIIPSLPGFGFSDAPVRSGMASAQIGVIFKNLMTRLGHKKFYLQGGDWGSLISSTIATMYAEDVLGFLTNMMFVLNSCTEVSTLTGAAAVAQGPPDRLGPVTTLIEEIGYIYIQSTKPDTIGIALAESPSGLLGWILEKFSTWTNIANRDLEDGGLCSYFTKDELLDNVMVYWSSNCITSSMRLYAEHFSYKYRALGIDTYPTDVATWGLKAKHEIFAQPPNNLKFSNILGYTELEEGGHFLAFERPQIFAENVYMAVDKFMEYHQTKNEL